MKLLSIAAAAVCVLGTEAIGGDELTKAFTDGKLDARLRMHYIHTK